MKKLLISALVCASAAVAFSAACSNRSWAEEYTAEVSEGLVVFTAPEIHGELSLREYFDGLVDEGIITYTLEGGMVSSINGVSNTSDFSSCWMFYSDLIELDGVIYGNTEWGTYEYEGKTLASCANGVETMPVVEGFTYAAVYETFS